MTQAYDEDLDRSLSPEDLCLIDSSNHEARIGDDVYYYQCALDAFVVGYLVDESVTVRSIPRTSDAIITVEFTDGEVRAVPADSVLSFGIAEDVEPPKGAITPETSVPTATRSRRKLNMNSGSNHGRSHHCNRAG